MRKVTVWITIVLSVLILGYSYHLNQTGGDGKTGDRNPACAQATPECQNDGKPGEDK